QIAAQVFPAQRPFVDKIVAEGVAPANNIRFGPFPNDRLTYVGDQVVEFETRPLSAGLGTYFGMAPNRDAILGAEILRDLVLQHLALRLPQEMKDLVPAITRQFEMN